MKKLSLSIFLTVLLSLLISGTSLAADTPMPRTITVTGQAEVKVVPNQVTLILGVETFDKDLTTAKKQNDDRIQKIISAAKAYGVEQKYIQTDYMTIQPRYKNYDETETFNGYFVRNMVSVTLNDPAKLEGFLSDALKDGANQVSDIQFQNTELKKYRDQARKMAIKAAQEKAVSLAGELEQKVGKPFTITDNSAFSYYGWSRGYQSNMMQNAIQDAGSGLLGGDDGTIALGQISIKAEVTVTFELQ